jgi:type IV pilus assembly protein PilX
MLKRCDSQLFLKQRGVVLVVAMLTLLVITIVGVAGMQTTILEETMAGAVRDKHIAFNTAEAGLREGEEYLTSASLPTFDDTNGRYSSDGTSEELWKTVKWTKTNDTDCNCITYSSGGLVGGSDIPLPRYIIEELPESEIESTSLVVGFKPKTTRTMYQITARGVGKMGAIAILQSTYLR